MTRHAKNVRADFRTALASKAMDLGFDVCRVASPTAAKGERERLNSWLANGAHGTMDWIAATAARRSDPRVLWPEVRSIVLLGLNYGPETDPLAILDQPDKAAISVYAQNRDYHDVLKGRLKLLAQWMLSGPASQQYGISAQGEHAAKVFVDTAPVMEKPLAAAAGIGWQGKHTNLVSQDFGSWLFLGSIFTTLELASDHCGVDHCGSCRACLDICPTQAFPGPYEIDARRCISYLTIEHKGHIGREFRRALGNRIYGCDDCLAVCPWNKFAQSAREAKLVARDDLREPAIADLLHLDEMSFRRMFSGSPVKRIGHQRFLRNVLIAAGNSGDTALLSAIAARATDSSVLVRAMAVWALARLADPEYMQAMAARCLPRERDGDVRNEWAVALAGQFPAPDNAMD